MNLYGSTLLPTRTSILNITYVENTTAITIQQDVKNILKKIFNSFYNYNLERLLLHTGISNV